eukprot:gene45298-55417_t
MASFAKSSISRRIVVWFRNDLRVHDNPVLSAAHSLAKASSTDFVCLYCFDPRHFVNTPYGNKKTGPFRAQFLLESVSDLRTSLRSLGSNLLVATGKPEDVIANLKSPDVGELVVLCQGEVTYEELQVEKAVEKAIKRVSPTGRIERIVGGCSLYHPEDLPFRADLKDLPDVFTPYREKVERAKTPVRPLLPPLPSLPAPPAA